MTRRGTAVAAAILFAFLLIPGWGGASGQVVPSPADTGLRAYLVTVGPGEEFWERFGHNAIWIHDPATSSDVGYDYGRFDFRAEHFFLRAAQGRMAYSMDSASIGRIIPAYASRERSVAIQELALDPGQVRALEARLLADVTKVREAGWTYQYDYYRDNCSTRLRDALDAVLGGAIARQTEGRIMPLTYRDHALRSTMNNPLVGFGLDLIQGPRVDAPLSAWGEMFLPGKLQEHLRTVRIGSGVDERPVVEREWVAAEGSRYAVPEAPPVIWPWTLCLGVALGGSLLGLARAGRRKGFLVLGAAYLGFLSLLCVAMLFLWTATTHVVAYRNANLFQANLLSTVLLFLLPAAVRGVPDRIRPARQFAMFVAAFAGAGLVWWLAGSTQQNGEVLALLVPATFGLVAGVVRLTTPGS